MGREVLYPSFYQSPRAGWRRTSANEYAVCAVVNPGSASLDELAGCDRRCVTEDGDLVALTAGFDAQPQKPFSSLWKVTRSTRPARTSARVLVAGGCIITLR